MNRKQFLLEKFNCNGNAPHFVRLSRWKQLPYLMDEMGLKVGVEVGTEQGRFADCLLRKIPNLKLSVIDCWEGYEGYRKHMKEKIKEYEKKARERLGGRCEIIKKYSMEAVKDFADNSLDFVFIDGNHEFRQVIDDIDEWTKKVKVGGLVMGHDFTLVDNGYERIDVEPAVRAWTEAKGIKTWFVTEEGDRMPTWFWIKERNV